MAAYKIVPLTMEEDETVKASVGQDSLLTSLARTEPPTITLNPRFALAQARIAGIKVRNDDVWIITPPKCGTTWTQEITWLALNKVDTVTAKEKNLFLRSPFIDFAFILNQSEAEVNAYFDQLDLVPSPRIIKSHLPFELLPLNLLDTCKVIFVCRNVKDAAVSYFHHERLMKVHDRVDMPFDKYAESLFRPGLVMLGGHFQMLESAWTRREHGNLLLLWYEEMKADQKQAITRIAAHTGVTLDSTEVEAIIEFTRLDNMRQGSNQPYHHNPNFHEGRGQFLRKGKVGDWSNHFSPSLSSEWDQWAEQELNRLGVTDATVRGYFGL